MSIARQAERPPEGRAGARPVAVFVACDGNRFMRDIAQWIVEAAAMTGREAALVDDRLPQPDGSINLVVAPHEFYVLRRDTDHAVRAAAQCSVPICTEQPRTPWFDLALGFCTGSPLVVDINALSLDAIHRAGFDVHRLRLGGVPGIDRRTEADRDIDVVFLGGHTAPRAVTLARLAPTLWDRRSQIRLFSFSRPLSGDEPGVVFGIDKYDLLARSKVLVNLHRGDHGDPGYFEWARMIEAMANGCAVVTEASVGHDPLVAGQHFVETTPDRLATDVIDLLDDDERRRRIADTAHRAIMVESPLIIEMNRLLARLDPLAVFDVDRPADGFRGRIRSGFNGRPVHRTHRRPLLPVFTPYRSIRRSIYDQLLAEIAHRRELSGLRSQLEFGEPGHVGQTTTPAWDAAVAPMSEAVSEQVRVEVSVVVTLFDYADVVVETLDSIVGSTDVAMEIVVVDDRSSDDGADVVRAWMDGHADVPVLFLKSAVNRGLTRSRNLAIEHSRAAKVMVMDADNLVYPTCLRRLADALDHDPDAAFAYSTLEAFGPDPGLRSAQGWYPPWLCEANYIDAQAMLRRGTLDRHGGYRVDDTMYGWEDWDLWLRLAVAGEYGAHVPEMLGRYRTQSASMVSLTNLAAIDLRADLVARYPTLPWPESAD